MTTQIWGNFMWWEYSKEPPEFRPEILYGSCDKPGSQAIKNRLEYEEDTTGPWISRPVCINIPIPPAIEADMPKTMKIEQVVAEVDE